MRPRSTPFLCALALLSCAPRMATTPPPNDAGNTVQPPEPTPMPDGPAPAPPPPPVVEPPRSDAATPGMADAAPPPPAMTGPDVLPACTRTVPASGALAAAITAATPGDCLLVPDGAYGDLTITAKGTEAAPIQVRAMNKLKATAGALQVANSAYVIVQGFSMGTLLIDNSSHARVTRCQIKGGGGPAWIRIDVQKGCMNGCTDTPPSASESARIDHCEIGPGNTGGDIMNPTALSTNARIDHNHFHDVSSAHVITVGCCGPKYDYHDTGHVIELNLFTNVRGGELISIKSSNSTFRYNTIRRSGGDVDIRAGRHDFIYGNYIFGPGGGGIRMYEDDHKIYNNYVETGKALQMGPPNAGHAAIKNATVVFNTFAGSVSTSGTGNVIANNLVVGGGNLGGTSNLAGSAADLGLVRMGELLVPSPTSKAVGAATGSFPFVTDDVTGQTRGKADIGAVQSSSVAPIRKPLTAADVGPDAP
jgi:poly(beta-D-mannuronate) lyase